MSAFCRKKNLNYFRNITSTSFFEQKTFWSRTFVIQYTVRRTAKKLKIIYYISYISEKVRNKKKYFPKVFNSGGSLLSNAKNCKSCSSNIC